MTDPRILSKLSIRIAFASRGVTRICHSGAKVVVKYRKMLPCDQVAPLEEDQ